MINKTMSVKEMEKKTKEIKNSAKNVYDISFDYHLTHAVFGGDKMLLLDRKKIKDENLEKLGNALHDATERNDEEHMKEYTEKINVIKKNYEARKYQIMIEYIEMKDPDGGRAVKANNKLVISLPQKLTKNLMDDAGKLQKIPIEKLRKKMAHELGHIVLHTEKLPKDMDPGNKTDHLDWEAEVFAKELLRLYSKKDHRIDWQSGNV